MTRAAMTAAGRRAAPRPASRHSAPPRPASRHAAPTRSPGGRAAPGRSPTPRPPRRVSGPVGGRSRAVAPRQAPTLGMRALAVVRSLPDHSLIDRLVRGRAWIPVLGVLLAGIVAMQVEILKLGTTTGRWMQRTSVLQSQNESLRASVASLNDDQRIERIAATMGMVMPSPSEVVFLSGRSGGAVDRVIANIHAPDPTGFAAQLAAQVAAAAALTSTPGPLGAAATISSPTAPATTSGPAAPATSSGSAPPTTSSGAPASSAGAPASSPAATPQSAPAPTSSANGGTGTAQLPATGAAGLGPAGSAQSGSSSGG